MTCRSNLAKPPNMRGLIRGEGGGVRAQQILTVQKGWGLFTNFTNFANNTITAVAYNIIAGPIIRRDCKY